MILYTEKEFFVNTLSITVDHYPNVSKRKKPLNPVKHTTENHARIVVHVSGKHITEKTIVVCGLSSGPIHYKTTTVTQYVAAHIEKNKVNLDDYISYENILEWTSIPIKDTARKELLRTAAK